MVVRPQLFGRVGGDTATPVGFVIRGRLEPVPPASSTTVWIRLSPVHARESIDVDVDASGEFRIYKPLAGLYVLMVIRGFEVLNLQPVLFEDGKWPTKPVVVHLVGRSPAILSFR